MRVLHIIGSPKGEDSTSTRVALAFLDAYQQAHPDHELTTLDVWTEGSYPDSGATWPQRSLRRSWANNELLDKRRHGGLSKPSSQTSPAMTRS